MYPLKTVAINLLGQVINNKNDLFEAAQRSRLDKAD
jgi:hypothetical protein